MEERQRAANLCSLAHGGQEDTLLEQIGAVGYSLGEPMTIDTVNRTRPVAVLPQAEVVPLIEHYCVSVAVVVPAAAGVAASSR